MLKRIESIRKKPKEVRERYAFWSALGFTAVIALFWVVSVPTKLDIFFQSDTQQEVAQGGFSRSFGDMRTAVIGAISSFTGSQGEGGAMESAEEVGSDDVVVPVDFSSFFPTSTDSDEIQKKQIEQKQERRVLIGTTSVQGIPSSTH